MKRNKCGARVVIIVKRENKITTIIKQKNDFFKNSKLQSVYYNECTI